MSEFRNSDAVTQINEGDNDVYSYLIPLAISAAVYSSFGPAHTCTGLPIRRTASTSSGSGKLKMNV